MAGSSHSTTVTVSDGQLTASALVTVNFTGEPGYGETQQVAESLIGDEYFFVEQEYYDTVEDYTYTSDYYYSEPSYDSTLQNSPVGDMTGMYQNSMGSSDYYGQMATETQQNANDQQTTTSTGYSYPTSTGTASTGGTTNSDGAINSSGTTTDTPPTSPEIDPRLQWSAFSFTNEEGFPEAALPAQSLLDDLFSLVPSSTDSFSTTTLTEAAPILETEETDELVAEKQTGRSTAFTVSQTWISPTEWVVTQSLTQSLNSSEAGTHADGAADTIGRSGFSTLTISVINGTRSVVTYTIFDSFSYSKSLEWDKEPESESPNSPDGGLAPLPASLPVTGSMAGDDATEDDDEGPVDKGQFNAGFQSTASMTVSMETILITLPDGRLARQYNFGYSTLSTFTSSLSASSQVKKQEGTLNNFLLEEGDEEENEDDISTDVTSVAWGASVSGGNPAPSGEEPVEEDAEGPALIVEHGGNGSSIDFGGNITYSDNFSKNFGLNLSAIVPEGESVDDAVVTGTGAFGVSTGYAQGGGSQLGIQVQASSGNPTVGDSGHEYLSFNSTSNGNQSADFSFDIDFEITGEDETSTSDNTTDGNTTSSQGTDTTAYSASTTNPDGTSSDNTTDPVDPPAPNFEFTYSTGNGEGGGSVLLYSKSSTIQSPAMTGGGSMSVTNTETLTASGTFSAGFSFDFGVLGGITIGVQSSGSGTLEYKSVSVTEHGLPDFNQPTEWYGSWHYPEMRNELTVTNTGSFNANVTITFGLLSGLGVDASYSADYTTAVKNLGRTDWAYWETDSDGVNTYKELGHVQTVTTVTTTFSGNLTDGFDAEVTDGWAFSGDIVFEGEKHSGPPPAIEDDSWLNPTTILDGVQLALDIGGMVPGLGEPLDAINAGISLGRGNYAEAALSIAAMLPIGGQAATGAKLANKAGNAVIKNLDKADEAVAGLSKVGDEFTEALDQYNRRAPDVPKIDVPCPSGGPNCFTPGHQIVVRDDGAEAGGGELKAERPSEVQWVVGLIVFGGMLQWVNGGLAAPGGRPRQRRRTDRSEGVLW